MAAVARRLHKLINYIHAHSYIYAQDKLLHIIIIQLYAVFVSHFDHSFIHSFISHIFAPFMLYEWQSRVRSKVHSFALTIHKMWSDLPPRYYIICN